MAATMAATYPELYAAVGVHSGLAHGSASDVASAFAAMGGKFELGAARRSLSDDACGRSFSTAKPTRRCIRPMAKRSSQGLGSILPMRSRAKRARPDRRAAAHYSRTVIADARGVPQLEHWAVEGLGHAWSGGNPDGSFADRHGPEASREMVRFFLAEASAAGVAQPAVTRASCAR